MNAILARLLLLTALTACPALAQESQAAVPASPAAPVPAAPAAASPEAGLLDMVKALGAFLTEEEVQMVYDYLWDASLAALKGSPDEVSLPPELAFKLAILQRRIVKEGGFYLEGLALKMERDLARWRENLAQPAPPVPYSLPSERAAPPVRP